MGRIILGLLITLAGAGAVIKTEWIIQNFGTNAWAEAKLGFNGGSRLLYKCMGIVGVLIGFMFITNMHQQFLMATVGKIFTR